MAWACHTRIWPALQMPGGPRPRPPPWQRARPAHPCSLVPGRACMHARARSTPQVAGAPGAQAHAAPARGGRLRPGAAASGGRGGYSARQRGGVQPRRGRWARPWLGASVRAVVAPGGQAATCSGELRLEVSHHSEVAAPLEHCVHCCAPPCPGNASTPASPRRRPLHLFSPPPPAQAILAESTIPDYWFHASKDGNRESGYRGVWGCDLGCYCCLSQDNHKCGV